MNPKDKPQLPFDRLMEEYEARLAKAMAMGGPEKLARRKAAGVLNARERVAYLCDPGTFIESGVFGTSSSNPADRDKSPADGKVAGFGKVDGRETAVIANDFTVMGASSSSTNGRKIAHLKRVAWNVCHIVRNTGFTGQPLTCH